MKVTLNNREIKLLERVFSYMHDSEEAHYEEYLEKNGNPDGHILNLVNKLEKYIDKNLVH